MDTEQVATFFAVLLLGGVIGVGAAIVTPRTRDALRQSALPLSAMVAVGAMAGSLYFSEIADYVPCELCWFQRIAMYPLAVILTIAAVVGDRGVWRYALPLAIGGIAVSIYHIQLQWFPDQSSFCEAFNPCSGRWIEAFGFVTIPQMAFGSFALVIALGVLSLQADQNGPISPDVEHLQELP